MSGEHPWSAADGATLLAALAQPLGVVVWVFVYLGFVLPSYALDYTHDVVREAQADQALVLIGVGIAIGVGGLIAAVLRASRIGVALLCGAAALEVSGLVQGARALHLYRPDSWAGLGWLLLLLSPAVLLALAAAVLSVGRRR